MGAVAIVLTLSSVCLTLSTLVRAIFSERRRWELLCDAAADAKAMVFTAVLLAIVRFGGVTECVVALGRMWRSV